MTRWTVVVPVKGTADAKSRLDASEALATAIALDTVVAAVSVARVIVVTSAGTGSELEAGSGPGSAPPSGPVFVDAGAEVVVDPGGGLNAAIRAGLEAAGADGAELSSGVAVLLGDLPALLPSELLAALTEAQRHPLAFVSDADGEGTVLITATGGAAHTPSFGAGSRAVHLAAGYVELDVAAESGLRRDVDTPDHLGALAERVGAHTKAALQPN